MECPLLGMEDHDDLSEDPPDEDLEQLPGQRKGAGIPRSAPPIHPPIVADKQKEVEQTGQDRVEEATKEIIRETVPQDVPAEVPERPGVPEPEVPIPVLPGPGPAPVRSGARQRATAGSAPGAALGSPETGRANTRVGNTPAAVAVAINRGTRELGLSGAAISAPAARAALVRRPNFAARPPGAAQGRARSLANLRGSEQVGAGRSDMPTRRGEINRTRAGVVEEATARTFSRRRLVGAMMTAAAAAQVFQGARTGGRRSGGGTTRFRGGGAGFFFNQARQLRLLLSQR